MTSNNYKDFWIVCAGAGAWYADGAKRLYKRLIELGYGEKCNLLFFYDYPKDCPTHQDHPYFIKISAIQEAIKRGAKKILWMDCSIYPYKNFDIVFDLITENGLFAWYTGANLAQTCSDKSLELFNLTRDEAENLYEVATTIIGFDIEKNIFFSAWHASACIGAFHGSRQHDNQSQDKRFMFHRQDQSAASLILQVGKKENQYSKCIKDISDFAQYNYDDTILQPDKYYFLIAGGYDNKLPKIDL